jgi:single-strand DNA-binding protein
MNRQYKDESGNKCEEITFVDVEAWGKQAETIAKYLVKGRPIFIEGRLKFDQWEDKTTQQKRSKIKVVLIEFQFLGGRDDNASPGESAGRSYEPNSGEVDVPVTRQNPPRNPRPAPPPQDNIDEDVPF